MLYFGKDRDGVWCFDLTDKRFEKSIEISEEEHIAFAKEIARTGKTIGGDKNGRPIIVDFPELPDKIKKQIRLRELEGILESTDWYAMRKLDTDEEIPADIKKQRQEAREEISKLREELEK